MKFMHIADVHLGAYPEKGLFDQINRQEEIITTFANMVREAERQQIPLLLIAGDLFHRQPLVRELREVNYLLTDVYHGHTVLIAGNHDYLKPDSNYRSFSWGPRIHLLLGDRRQGIYDRVYLPELECQVDGFSYGTREITDPLYSRTYCPTPLEEDCMRILLAHGGDEKHIPIRAGQLEELPYHYIALGHIHKPGAVLPDRAIYAGAPEPIDRNDPGEHGYVLGEMTQGADGSVEVHTRFIPVACRSYYSLEIEVQESDTMGSIRDRMEQLIQERGEEHFYKWSFVGTVYPGMDWDPSRLERVGHTVEILDRTRPAYDLRSLEEQHREDLIGRFIRSFPETRTDEEEQALLLGLQAMLE